MRLLKQTVIAHLSLLPSADDAEDSAKPIPDVRPLQPTIYLLSTTRPEVEAYCI
jgi:hypothetical protein